MVKGSFTGEVYSKEHYDKIFAEIAALSTSLSPKDITAEIQKRINLTLLLGQEMSQPMLDKFDFYRLRVPKLDEIINEDESSSYSYPPDPKDITCKGRANIEGQQVFYASADGHTVFQEKENDIVLGQSTVYLTKWGIRNLTEPIFVRSLFLGAPEGAEDTFSRFMAQRIREAIEMILRNVPNPHKDDFIYGQKKYAEIFTSEGEELYHISSAIAHGTFVETFDKGADIPMLAYPSVAKERTAINYAIRKDFVDKHLYLKEVYKLTVTEIDGKKIASRIHSRGVMKDGKMIWSYPHIDARFTSAFISPDGKLNNMKGIEDETLFTVCCKDHTMTLKELLTKMDITKSRVLDFSNEIPHNIEYDGPKAFDCLIPIPIDFELYLNTDISETGKIKFLMLPVRYFFSYEELQQTS